MTLPSGGISTEQLLRELNMQANGSPSSGYASQSLSTSDSRIVDLIKKGGISTTSYDGSPTFTTDIAGKTKVKTVSISNGATTTGSNFSASVNTVRQSSKYSVGFYYVDYSIGFANQSLSLSSYSDAPASLTVTAYALRMKHSTLGDTYKAMHLDVSFPSSWKYYVTNQSNVTLRIYNGSNGTTFFEQSLVISNTGQLPVCYSNNWQYSPNNSVATQFYDRAVSNGTSNWRMRITW